jgi:hypothetical protein
VTDCLAALALDRRFLGWVLAWWAVALLTFGLGAAIIPNPVFGRQIPPEPFAIAVWLLSAPLMGLIGATYTAPRRSAASAATRVIATPLVAAGPPAGADPVALQRVGRLATAAGFGAFLAIGCPVCNKVALVLLGASGALTIWAPLQPLLGAASLALLAATAAWRFRLRRDGEACAR